MSNTIVSIENLTKRYDLGVISAGDASWARLRYSGVFMLVVKFIGVVIFNRVEETFIDTV